MKQKRLDMVMVECGLVQTRSQAQGMILAGDVLVNGVPIRKAGEMVFPEDGIVLSTRRKYVSRGGWKMEKALSTFPISLEGKICLDVGASTGGFTHCMLQHGASRVYAIDVGYGQLDYTLRLDRRVVSMERYNARTLSPEDLGTLVEFSSVDVSFISLKLILPSLLSCLVEAGEVVALVKPQFEAGRGQVGKHGVVRDANVHRHVLKEVMQMAQETEYSVLGLTPSPIKGPKGNIEFLLYLRKEKNEQTLNFIAELAEQGIEDAAGLADHL